jgi:N-acetylmuramoyl-L-alanine amidase
MSSYKRVILSFVIPVLVFLLAPADPDTSIAAETKRHKISRIVVDPGHGGKDPGAIGPCGEKEKDITLAVGIKLAARLTEKGYEVLLTDDTDVFYPP